MELETECRRRAVKESAKRFKRHIGVISLGKAGHALLEGLRRNPLPYSRVWGGARVLRGQCEEGKGHRCATLCLREHEGIAASCFAAKGMTGR